MVLRRVAGGGTYDKIDIFRGKIEEKCKYL